MIKYTAGTHIIATLSSRNTVTLHQYEGFKDEVSKLATAIGLKIFGALCHNDEAGGFTAMFSLENIQLSVRTWPHSGKVNLDIYCASAMPANDHLASDLFDVFTAFFNGIPEQRQIIYR